MNEIAVLNSAKANVQILNRINRGKDNGNQFA